MLNLFSKTDGTKLGSDFVFFSDRRQIKTFLT